jgi:uncharacterized damage-inducible protein DinB
MARRAARLASYSMPRFLVLVLASLPALAAAQNASPVSDAFRADAKEAGANLIAAAQEMPAEKYGYKPTPAQMSFGKVITHLAVANAFMCGAIGGVPRPERSKLTETDSKEQLIGLLRDAFAFCDRALGSLDDSKLGERLKFGDTTLTRATIMTLATGDWADHYSQVANYLRLNGLVPPTARR